MGSQSSKAPRGDVTAEEAAGASPAKANGQVGALDTARPGPLLSHLAPIGPWAGAARFVRPGTRGAPSPARSLCSPRRSPRGRSKGRGGEGAPAEPRRLLCSRPWPPALPPGRPECRAGNKGPRQGGAQGPLGGCPPLPALHPQPGLQWPTAFFSGGSRDVGRTCGGWGAFYTKLEARAIGRPGAEDSAPGWLPVQSRLARPPARRGSTAASGSARNGECAPGEVDGGPRDPSASCRPQPPCSAPARLEGQEGNV